MPYTHDTTPVRDHKGGTAPAVEPITTLADDVENKPAESIEPQGPITYTADDVDNKPAESDTPAPEPQTFTQWPHEAIVKTVQGEDKTVKQTKTKKKAS